VTLLVLLALYAQSGHWEGAIRQEGGDALFSIDLDNSPDWRGSFEVPGSKAPPLTLSNVTVENTSISFDIADLPADPEFKGILGENGASIRGTVTEDGRTVAFEMRRVGEPHVKSPPANTPMGAPFLGDWTGAVEGVKVVLHLRPDATGTLDSADGRARNLSLSAIAQTGVSLAFDVRLIGGRFEGKLSEGGTRIEGEWTQNGRTVPLVFGHLAK
jgi:hypothetical protein